jgi:hypothetical protein
MTLARITGAVAALLLVSQALAAQQPKPQRERSRDGRSDAGGAHGAGAGALRHERPTSRSSAT